MWQIKVSKKSMSHFCVSNFESYLNKKVLSNLYYSKSLIVIFFGQTLIVIYMLIILGNSVTFI